jgi:hypothetical protein
MFLLHSTTYKYVEPTFRTKLAAPIFMEDLEGGNGSFL